MKIASTLQRNNSEFEQRKRLLARKEMDLAYKKNAKFVEASKNPLLAALENLLSGKAEKDLLEQEVEAKKDLDSNLFNQEVKEIQSQGNDNVGRKVVSSEDTRGDEIIQLPLTKASKESIQVEEKLGEASTDLTQQSLQGYQNVSTLQTVDESPKDLEEEPPYAGESFNIEVPNRFSNEVKRNVKAPTVFGKELEKELFIRTFNKAKSTYSTHISMVKNSYRSYNEPQFSLAV